MKSFVRICLSPLFFRKEAIGAPGITKPASLPHDIRAHRDLFGHTDVSATVIYTRVLPTNVGRIREGLSQDGGGQQSAAADDLQRTVRCRFRARLSARVRRRGGGEAFFM